MLKNIVGSIFFKRQCTEKHTIKSRGMLQTAAGSQAAGLPSPAGPSLPNNGGLHTVISANIRGLTLACDRTKPAQLGDIMSDQNTTVLALSETWLTPEHLDAEVNIKGYNLFRADRLSRPRGGVALYIREDMATVPILQFSNDAVEIVAVKIKALDSIYFSAYRPPDTSTDEWEEAMEALTEAIHITQAHQRFLTVIGSGDFNLPNVDWADTSCPAVRLEGASREAMAAARLFELTDSQFLEQIVKVPTREGNILDLVFSNNTQSISHYEVIHTVIMSDHSLLITVMTDGPGARPSIPAAGNVYTTKIGEFDMRKGTEETWTSYQSLLSNLDWGSMAAGLSLVDRVKLLEDTIVDAVSNCFPVKGSKVSGNRIPKQMRKLMNRRKKLGIKLLKSKSAEAVTEMLSELESVEITIKESHERKIWREEKAAVEKIKSDPTAFYNFARSRSRAPAQVGPLSLPDGSHTSDPSTMAETLSTQYSSVFTVPRETVNREWLCNIFPSQEEDRQVEDSSPSSYCSTITFTMATVEKAVSQLSNTASPGPDGITPMCYKQGGSFVTKALVDIFQRSLDSSSVPEALKTAFITPIWKGSDKTKAASYRPVALTSHLSKIFERLIRAPMIAFLEAQGKMDPSQHGARAGRSTVSQLLIQHDLLLKLMEDGDNADVVYLDFSKAFNKVDFSLLLRKIANFGFIGNLGKWLGNFLTNRLQAVRVGNSRSKWAEVKSGVPQGTVLGPLLFLLFISDLGKDLPASSASRLLKYVDDTKVIRKISSEADVEELQEDLNCLYKWQEEANMAWNDSKFVVLRMGPSAPIRESTHLFTPHYGGIIEEREVTRDLGIEVDNNCNFGPQRVKAIKKAKAKAAWILRTFSVRDLGTMRTLWRTMIQPHLDYGSQLWSPVRQKGDLHKQESVLRAYTKRIGGLSQLPYWERLQASGLQSTERRMERYKILYTWKALKGLVPYCGIHLASRQGSRRGLLAAIPPLAGSRMAIQTLKERALSTEGPRLFNSLPSVLRSIDESLLSFKARLDSYLAMVPDQPFSPGRPYTATHTDGSPSNSIRDWAPLVGDYS